ncbi:MAG: NusG domain II-containing protein [Clostridiales bacterium]|nr:NusG domain II-containing protein [Clostridiales bacterium]
MSAKKWAAALAAVFALAASAAFFLSRSYPEGGAVGVYYNGEIIYTIYPEEDGEYVVTGGDGGRNVVTVSGGRVAMTEASCPDQVCVRHGALRENDAIICVPNGVVVRAIDGGGDVDAVAGR